MLTIVVILKALTEIAGLALLGQGILFVLAGANREQNLFYKLLKTVTSPIRRAVRFITPRFVPDRHIGIAAFFLAFQLFNKGGFFEGFQYVLMRTFIAAVIFVAADDIGDLWKTTWHWGYKYSTQSMGSVYGESAKQLAILSTDLPKRRRILRIDIFVVRIKPWHAFGMLIRMCAALFEAFIY